MDRKEKKALKLAKKEEKKALKLAKKQAKKEARHPVTAVVEEKKVEEKKERTNPFKSF